MTDFNTFSTLVARLVEERRVAILCGAGISRASGLPVVADVLEDLFAWLRMSPDETQAISASAMPFERIMELVLGELPSREPFLQLFDLGAPSLFHHFVAALHQRRLIGLVATTNFDRLLERAIDARAGDTSFATAIEPSQLLALGERPAAALRLVKLHGCVSQPHTMATELYMVGSALLTPARRKAVEWVFQTGPHSHVLVVGYSCSDAFDIGPILHSLNGGNKTVLFVSHRSGDGHSPIRLAECECPPSAQSFANWKGVVVDTSRLIERICSLLRLEDVSGSQPATAVWRPAFAAWLTECDAAAPASRDLAAGRLLTNMALATSAVDRLANSLRVAQQGGDSKTLAACYLALAHVKVRHTGAIAEARSHMNAARDLLGSTPPRESEMQLLRFEAEFDSLAGNFAASARRLARVLDLCANELERGNSEYALAIVLRKAGEYEESETHFHRAINAFDVAGDLVDKARAIGDLGNLYAETGNLDAARRRYEEALELSKIVGDKHGEAVRRANLGSLALRTGDADHAIAGFKQPIAVARASGDLNALSSRVGNLGMVFYKRRELEKALDHFNEALALARQVKDRDRELRWITNLGVTLGRLGRTNQAIERLEDAERRLSEMLGTDHPRVRWVRECLIFARSQAISAVVGDEESCLMALGPGGMVSVSWDTLAP